MEHPTLTRAGEVRCTVPAKDGKFPPTSFRFLSPIGVFVRWKELKGGYRPQRTKNKIKNMSNNQNKYSAAVIALMAADRAGVYQTAAQAPVKSSCRAPRLFACSLAGIALTFALANAASAQTLTWDNTLGNPFVASGNADQCTAYAWGRFKNLNGTALEFTSTSGRNGGRLYALAVETPYVYRDSVPVRGSLISWTKGSAPGHAAIVESPNIDGLGKALISEQNWPLHWGPNSKNLDAAALLRRTSTAADGTVSIYTLAGYVNPNRATAIGTLYTTRITTTALQLNVALLDEDKRPLSVLVGIFAGGIVVSGTSVSGTVNANSPLTVRWSNTSQWVRGKTYTITLWVTDFRGLRSSKSTTFVW